MFSHYRRFLILIFPVATKLFDFVERVVLLLSDSYLLNCHVVICQTLRLCICHVVVMLYLSNNKVMYLSNYKVMYPSVTLKLCCVCQTMRLCTLTFMYLSNYDSHITLMLQPNCLQTIPTCTHNFICFINSNICSGGREATALLIASGAFSA